jgi:LPXTG-motif cell wall-anchored protein
MARNNGFVPVETQGQDVERDDDLLADDDGIFDSSDDIFDERDDNDTDGEGVFADNTSIFSRAGDPAVDHSNAITTREMDARRYEDAKPHESMKIARAVYDDRAGFKSAPKSKKQKRVLVAKFDEQGRPLVAHFADGKQLEGFRMPTEREFHSLKTKGKIVRGGVGEAPAVPVESSIPWKKILLAGGVAVAGGAAWYFWKKRKNGAEVVDNVQESAAFDDEADDTDDSED